MKTNILKRNEDFNKIIKEGKRNNNSHFIVYSLPSLSFVREDFNIGISVGKKIGNAPVRNKQKRIVRDIVRKLAKENLIPNKQFVIISKSVCIKSDYELQYSKLKEIFKKERA